MPGIYKEKTCPTCGTTHRKRGPYCCQACANRDRPEYSPKVSENMRKVATEYNRTPEAIAKQSQINTSLRTLTVDDFAVDIPTIPELPEGYTPNEF